MVNSNSESAVTYDHPDDETNPGCARKFEHEVKVDKHTDDRDVWNAWDLKKRKESIRQLSVMRFNVQLTWKDSLRVEVG